MDADDVRERLGFAERRLDELLDLNGGDLAGADVHERQQLIQELFFHLIGAIEVLAQLVNEARGLGLDDEDVAVYRVADRLGGGALAPPLRALHVTTRRQPLPADPYSDDGLLFRVYNYRHQVTHRRRNPFHFSIGLGSVEWRTAHLLLDPRESAAGPSQATIEDDLRRALALVRERCEQVLVQI